MDESPKRPRKFRQEPDASTLIEGVRNGDRALLARAITLIESRATRHFDKAQEVLQAILPDTGKSIRIGLTGVPGAGKSTFLEAMGVYLCEKGHKIAVLAVDPSSARTGGSILGDKTRMEKLTQLENAFIRPSPSGDQLGGIAAKTREAMLLCEAAGYDILFIETVGVGQSETAVRTMTDFFLLLQITGAGDELQGIKKGIIELADAIVINKADGDNLVKAQQARSEFNRVLHIIQPFTEGWSPKAYTCSALEGKGLEEIWQMINDFVSQTEKSGVFQRRRREQNVDWFQSLTHAAVLAGFQQENADKLKSLEQKVGDGELPVALAVKELLG